MDLTEALREASDSPPPTSIDLDALIGGERRRERQMRWLAGSGVAAGLAVSLGVAAVGLPPALQGGLSGGGGPRACPSISPGSRHTDPPPPGPAPTGYPLPEPSGSASIQAAPPGVTPTPLDSTPPPPVPSSSGPSASFQPPDEGPVPTESCGSAQARFNGALTKALRAYAPSAKIVNNDDPRQTPIWFRQMQHSLYADVSVTDGARSGTLMFLVEPYARVPRAGEGCDAFDHAACVRDVLDDGTVIVRQDTHVILDKPENAHPGNFSGYQVAVFRPDHTEVWITLGPIDWLVDGIRPDQLPLTRDQLVAIARMPEFTLFP